MLGPEVLKTSPSLTQLQQNCENTGGTWKDVSETKSQCVCSEGTVYQSAATCGPSDPKRTSEPFKKDDTPADKCKATKGELQELNVVFAGVMQRCVCPEKTIWQTDVGCVTESSNPPTPPNPGTPK